MREDTIANKRRQDTISVYGYADPEFDKLKRSHPDYRSEYENAQKFFKDTFKGRALKKEVVDYAISKNIHVKQIKAIVLEPLAFNSWMLNNGCEIEPDAIKALDARITELAKAFPEREVVDLKMERTNVIIGEFEGLLDDATLGKTLENPSAILDRVATGSIHKEVIITHFQRQLDDITNFPDDYANLNPTNLKKIKVVLGIIVKTLSEAKVSTVNKPRKARKARKVVPAKVVAKMKFLKEDKENSLKSINPVEILDSTILWVYNIKTRKLGTYQAKQGEKLSVKGSTILNFDEDLSTHKKLRKPKEVLLRLSVAGKVDQRKILQDAKSVEAKLNGRINKDTVLVKVF